MDFENMVHDCPWLDTRQPMTRCEATGDECIEQTCAPFHFVNQIKDALYVSVTAEIRNN